MTTCENCGVRYDSSRIRHTGGYFNKAQGRYFCRWQSKAHLKSVTQYQDDLEYIRARRAKKERTSGGHST